MKLLADNNIPYIQEFFGINNQICIYEGRSISANNLKNIDILIVRSITMVNSILLSNSIVKFVGTVTSGIDHIDQNYLKQNNIEFAFAPGSNAISVVEYVLSALFWLAHRDGFFLRDKTIGIVGAGHIGGLLNQRLKSFGIHTLLYDPYLSQIDTNVNWTSLDKLVSESDILTFHTPLTYSGEYPTWHMVDLDLLDALSDSSILINTSRGGVVDNVALLKVLECGKKIRVVLDVWESEPYLLWTLLPYVDIGTAHIAGHTIESKLRGIRYIYDSYCKYFNFPNVVNLSNILYVPIEYITLNKVDECSINQLMQFIYNIRADHFALKNCINNPKRFDVLRRYYCRREWSSVCIRTDQDRHREILFNLGFNVI